MTGVNQRTDVAPPRFLNTLRFEHGTSSLLTGRKDLTAQPPEVTVLVKQLGAANSFLKVPNPSEARSQNRHLQSNRIASKLGVETVLRRPPPASSTTVTTTTTATITTAAAIARARLSKWVL
jgi:hypothetical protein